MLEQIKTLYNPTPGMPPDKIGPTVGQNSAPSLPNPASMFTDSDLAFSLSLVLLSRKDLPPFHHPSLL